MREREWALCDAPHCPVLLLVGQDEGKGLALLHSRNLNGGQRPVRKDFERVHLVARQLIRLELNVQIVPSGQDETKRADAKTANVSRIF